MTAYDQDSGKTISKVETSERYPVTETKIIDCYEFELCLNDGTKYLVTCGREEIDKLTDLIGTQNVLYVEEL